MCSPANIAARHYCAGECMIIQSLDVTGFLGRKSPLSIKFHRDLNIVTGFNGAGKTNLLKLLWYACSGNTYALLSEVDFHSFKLVTTQYTINMYKLNQHTCKGTLVDEDGLTYTFEDELSEETDEYLQDARDQFDNEIRPRGSSVFFPTFRRIEGGFTINPASNQRNRLFNVARPKGELIDAVANVSRKLSNQEHTFVTSISTYDIAELLLRHFNEMSDEATNLQTEMSQDVIKKIRDFRRDTKFGSLERAGEEAIETLTSIQEVIENGDIQRETIMAPMRAVQETVGKIFKHKGIEVNRRVSFGDAVSAISSDLLSAGEKQMLSFICYNAFTDDSPIFIDEPELSLHVDWQRILFPTLQSQKKNNQFIIATHSPFIYSKYPEREISLVNDRGEGLSFDL